MGLTAGIIQPLGKPVVPSGIAIAGIHPLLDHTPAPFPGEEKGVMVKVIAILKGTAVHLGDEATHPDQGVSLNPIPVTIMGYLLRGL